MVMSKASEQNVPNISGNDSSKIVKSIHNMLWLKKATVRKVSDHSEKAADKMFNVLATMDNGETSNSKKKNKKRNRKPKKNDGVEPINAEIANKIVQGQGGNSKNAWSSGKNPVESLFPEASEATSAMQLSEEEQIKLAVDASIETAFLEKCVLDSPEPLEVGCDKDDKKFNDDIWSGKCNNLPESTSEETKNDSDANNNSGLNKTQTSDIAKTTVEDEVPKNDPTPKIEEAESEAKKIEDACIDAQAKEVPYDQYGRVGGFSERHRFMGRGARKREDEERRQLRQGPVNGSNQKQRHVDHAPNDSSRPRNPHAPVTHPPHDNHGPTDRPNNRQRRYSGFPESHGPRNPHIARNDSYNDHPRRHPAYGNSEYKSTDRPYDSSRNSYKVEREPNARGGYNRIERNYRRPNNEDNNRYNNDTNKEEREKVIPPLLSMKAEHPSAHATTVKNGRRAIVGSAVETPKENTPEIEQEVCVKKPEKPPEDVIPKYQISDFNSRDKVLQEPTTLPIVPTSSPSSESSSVKAETTGYGEAADVPCEKNEIPIDLACFTVPPPGFEFLERSKNPCSNTAYVVPIESSLRSSPFVLPAQSPHNCAAHTLPVNTPIGRFANIRSMEELFARIKIYDPNLYQLLQEKLKLDEIQRNAALQGTACAMIPMNCSEPPPDPRILQDSHTRSFDFPVEQRQPVEMLNPNAKQYFPMSEQGSWAPYNQQDSLPGYSAAASYDNQSMPAYIAETSQEMFHRNNSGWATVSSQPMFHQEQESQTRDMTETAILGRQNSLVSEQNYSIQNVQRPMNLPILNDDYLRFQTSGYENIPSIMQRQVQYQCLPPQYGIAQSQVCSIPCAASYGNNAQGMMNKCMNCTPRPFQNYADFLHTTQNMNQGNIEHGINDNLGIVPSQSCMQRERNSITQVERQFVQQIIQPNSLENKPIPGIGRGCSRSKKY